MPDPISLDSRPSPIRQRQLPRGRTLAKAAVVALLSAAAVACGSAVESPVEPPVEPLPTDGYAYAAYPVEGTIDRIQVQTSRGMMTSTVTQGGVSVTQTWSWSGSAWVKDSLLTDWLRSWCMNGIGVVAGIGSASLWISTAPGAWQKQDLPSGVANAMAVSGVGCADDAVLISTISPLQVFRLDGSGWVDLQYPTDQATGLMADGLALFPLANGEVYAALRTTGYAFRPGPTLVARFASGTWQSPATDQISGEVMPVGPVIGTADGYLYAIAQADPYMNVARFGANAALVNSNVGFENRVLSPRVGPGGKVWGIGRTEIAWPTPTGSDLHTLRDGRTATGAGWVSADTTLWLGTSGAVLAVRRSD
jgi:hypothetical protein